VGYTIKKYDKKLIHSTKEKDMKECIKVIQKEIEWCKKNENTFPIEFKKGFIMGFVQSLFIIKEIQEKK
jgi:hypothetical protein